MRRITCPTNCALVLSCMLLWPPIASGQQTSATGTPQPVAGTTVVVRMIDAVDSGSDPAGKQYRASLAGPVNAGNNITIAQGSVATITLIRNASGWAARLTSLFINGRVTPADSSSAALAGTAPHSLDNDVAVLTGRASGTSTVAGLAAVASGARIILLSGTSLSFVLNAPAANGPAPANPAQANASVLPANQPGRSYYCMFNDTFQRPNMTHYFSGVFQADASQIEVSKAWTNYIRQNYLPGDNRDSGSCQIGTADQQQRVETTLRQSWQAMATGSEGAGRRNIPTNTAVDVSWEYVPDHPSASSAVGTPPHTAAASVAPPAYTAPAVPAAQPPAPQGASDQPSACDLISRIDAEAIVGFPLQPIPGPDRSKCTFMGSRPGLMSAVRIQVYVDVRYSATPNPGAVNQRRQLFKDSVRAGVLKDVPDVADAALWDWTNDYGGTGRLVAYKGGTTELFVTIEGIAENTALPGAERFAARALGGKTGYVYTAPALEKACDPTDFHNISGCLTAAQALRDSGLIGDWQGPAPADMGGPAMVELVKARAEFWATYPNPRSDRHAQSVVRLRKALSAVDFTYLYVHFYSLNLGLPSDGSEQQRQTLYQAALGALPEDKVIHDSARKQFDAWIVAVYNRLNGGFSDILNIRTRLPQALDETEVVYQRYRTARDTAEFLLSGQKP